MAINPYMAKLIRAGRRARGLTQAELADRLGVREHDIYRWERGTEPTRTGLLLLMLECDLVIDDVIEAFHRHDLDRGQRRAIAIEDAVSG
jgi:transcriptional regulator with XRE-family HTH domain